MLRACRQVADKARRALGAFAFTRRSILGIYLVAVGLNSLVFYLFSPGYYDRNANLLLSILTRPQVPVIAVAGLATVAGTLAVSGTTGILAGMVAGALAGTLRRTRA